MLTYYFLKEDRLIKTKLDERVVLTDLVWVDLYKPTSNELKFIEEKFALKFPQRERLEEIESSSLLYEEGNAYYMNVSAFVEEDNMKGQTDQFTFVIKANRLFTLSSNGDEIVKTFCEKNMRSDYHYNTIGRIFLKLVDVTIGFNSNVLAKVGKNVQGLASKLLQEKQKLGKSRNYEEILKKIGAAEQLSGIVRENLMETERLYVFLNNLIGIARNETFLIDKDFIMRLKTLNRDIISLLDYANFITGKINFALDATLGLVNIEQNSIIKIFSVASVAFLPPTLIASIYGMNFRHLPELNWQWGYPMAILIMFLSAFLPYKFFKNKGWL